MEDLLTCPWKAFVDNVGEISDLQELQNTLWHLEEEYSKSLQSKNQRKNFTFADVKGMDESTTADGKQIIQSRLTRRKAKEAFEELPKEMLLKRKIKYSRETLLMLKNKSREKVGESLSRAELKNFSYGIEQRQEPQKMFEARCQYRRANKITKGNMTASYCGDLKWYNEPGLNIDQIGRIFAKTKLNVPMDTTSSDRVKVEAKDILAALSKEEEKRGKLRLVKVQIDDDDRQEPAIEYFILMSVDGDLSWDDPEVQTFFVQTYLSDTYRNLALKSTRTGECLYGGRIVKHKQGQMELRFYQDEMLGIEKASRNRGTTRTPEGKGKRQSLKGMIEGIRIDLAERALRKAFELPEGDR